MPEIEKMKNLFSSYSFEDLAKSLFVLNLWLPNVASPIKAQYLYIVLESVFNKLQKENKITEYKHFKKFVEKVFSILPSFPMMEDYIPENDWGEIKYSLNKKFYKIFYGGDLENTYDYYYSFEVIHKGFEEFYLEKIGRSPLKELEFCVTIQDQIINGIDSKSQDKRSAKMAEFELPPEDFWKIAIEFLDNFNPLEIANSDLVNEYTKDLDAIVPEDVPSEGEFLQRAHDGKNCFYFFLKKDGKIIPVLPRNFFAVLFDKWGKILGDYYSSIIKDVKYQEIKIGVELYHFIRQRVEEDNIFFICSAIQRDLKPHKTIFTTAFRSKNKLVAIHVLPPSSLGNNQQKILESMVKELREANKLLSDSPTRLGLHGEGKMVQFQSSKKENATLEPLIITVVPHVTTDFGIIDQPNGLVGEIIGLDQLLGIMDELKDLDELAEFFDYVKSMRDSFTLSPISSYLDMFGAFRDSHAVLVPGANAPNLVVLDPHWGSDFRYRSLSKFWSIFPEENFFGHPRSWSIIEGMLKENVLILKSKTFFGYVYCCLLDTTSFFINSPVHALSFEQGKISDSMMGSLADAMILYKNDIQKLSFAKTGEKIHALFFPLSLIKNDQDFAHLRHLIPSGTIWTMDITHLNRKDYGIRIVFDDEKIIEALKDARDRSIQIELLLSALREIDTIFNDSDFPFIETKLEAEKTKKNRFRIFASVKRVSFPEAVKYTQPKTKDLKSADKKIAEIAKSNSIAPGRYEGKEAKIKVNLLRDGLISYLNGEVAQFKFETSISVLIRNIDAFTSEYERKNAQVINSLDQEVDYERDAFSGESKQHFLHNHKNHRYLIEKFVQLQPTGEKDLTNEELGRLLALVDRLLTIYAVSDFLCYGIYPSRLIIGSDFLADIDYGADINKMQTEWAQGQAQISLGMIGNKNDRLSTTFDIESYLDEIDENFKVDLGFSFKDMINVQNILSLWAAYHTDATEYTSYSATLKEISEACSKNINGFDSSKTEIILDFLTLNPGKILLIEDDPTPAPDLPVWEYRKRAVRYSTRPLIKFGEKYYWGAYSTERSGRVWANTQSENKLPADIKAPKVEAILKKGHEADEATLQEKIKEVVSRFTPYIEENIYPDRLGMSTTDIGDMDVFALLKEKNILLNIESKIIDLAFCNKDLKRIAEKIFGRISTTDGSFVEGYIQMVEKRDQFLDSKGKEIAEKYWDPISAKPKVVSLFVTQSAYWWTKFPPIKTKVHFVEVELLEEFIKNL